MKYSLLQSFENFKKGFNPKKSESAKIIFQEMKVKLVPSLGTIKLANTWEMPFWSVKHKIRREQHSHHSLRRIKTIIAVHDEGKFAENGPILAELSIHTQLSLA